MDYGRHKISKFTKKKCLVLREICLHQLYVGEKQVVHDICSGKSFAQRKTIEIVGLEASPTILIPARLSPNSTGTMHSQRRTFYNYVDNKNVDMA